MKQTNRFTNRIIAENEHVVMRDAVRLGGMDKHARPSFWLWVALERVHSRPSFQNESEEKMEKHGDASSMNVQAIKAAERLADLERLGRTGQWAHLIARDVARSFGNMPPHKTGAKLRADSIVRALVTFGRGRVLKRGVRGGGEIEPVPSIDRGSSYSSNPSRSVPAGPRLSNAPAPWEAGTDDQSHSSDISPTDTVSDWGGISPVGSTISAASAVSVLTNDANETSGSSGRYCKPSEEQLRTKEAEEVRSCLRSHESTDSLADMDVALSAHNLSIEKKTELQNKLSYILHLIAASHPGFGYCQGMDYIVAHLLRIVQDTVLWKATKGSLPASLKTYQLAEGLEAAGVTNGNIIVGSTEAPNTKHVIVEEAVFQVMDCLLKTYNLQHMYWPELRCLKTCCRVFERLIQMKLPVLADHFDHHELNVGLFALGWFQTIFLYIPSMPSATVCRMWDIWLVERSFKIFFRVATAILFLSQPILLNHELEGMMTYLNTFPDATLLNPDILIPCALQIKITNRMLAQIEMEVTGYDPTSSEGGGKMIDTSECFGLPP
mmetsp:Transcript_49437/g.148945  ORF Transcript_49437/g.148945 Transcript_49437/m.148945 type:complete len:551 (-) Transcript_49437:52-1704(-)